jgi:general secretion pathway protein J
MTPAARPTHRQAGFTLLEVLVALVVLGFLLLGLAEGTRFGLRAWDTETALVERGADMDATERLLRRLIEAADPGDVNEPVPFHGQPRTLTFVSRLPASVAGAFVTRSAEVALGVDQKHRLVLRWSLHPHAERLTKADPPRETVLLEGVDHLAFDYQRAAAQGGGWVETWDQRPTLPMLVRVTVVFPKDDRRHWPAIEAGPMLSRSDQ